MKLEGKGVVLVNEKEQNEQWSETILFTSLRLPQVAPKKLWLKIFSFSIESGLCFITNTGWEPGWRNTKRDFLTKGFLKERIENITGSGS